MTANDDLAQLLFAIEDNGLAHTAENYPQWFERISDQLGYLAWAIAADMSVLRERVQEMRDEADL